MVAHSSANRLDLSSESTSIIKQCKSRRNFVATSQSTTCDSINLLHPIMKVPHCVSAHTFRRSTRMRNRFTLSGAPHMKIINSSWKVEGTRNCKLLRCSPPHDDVLRRKNISICGRRWIWCGFAERGNARMCIGINCHQAGSST